MRKLKMLVCGILAVGMLSFGSAQAACYKVQRGDSLWKIAVKYAIGLSELRAANPQITNANVIYPNQEVTVPEKDTALQNYVSEVVRLTNAERAKYGLKPLTEDWQLSRVAQEKAQDMKNKNYFSHTSPTYGSPFDMMKSYGISYRYAAENIAKGYQTPAAVVNGWMNSEGHRKNILNANYKKIGIGYVENGKYWVQMFTD